MFKLRKEINGENPPPKRRVVPPVFPSQINMNLWFIKNRNGATRVTKESVRKIGVRSVCP